MSFRIVNTNIEVTIIVKKSAPPPIGYTLAPSGRLLSVYFTFTDLLAGPAQLRRVFMRRR